MKYHIWHSCSKHSPVLKFSFSNDVITLRKALDEGSCHYWTSQARSSSSPCSTDFRTGSHGTDREGTKTGGALPNAVIAPLWGKRHIPGNLPLPASSLLTPASLLSSYLTGWGASLAWSMVIKWRRGEERRGITVLTNQTVMGVGVSVFPSKIRRSCISESAEINLKGHYLLCECEGERQTQTGQSSQNSQKLWASTLAERRAWCNRSIVHRLPQKRVISYSRPELDTLLSFFPAGYE